MARKAVSRKTIAKIAVRPVSALEARARIAPALGALPAGVNFSQAISEAMRIARKFCSFLNPESQQPAITNWPTQLLGNRILSGSLTYRIGQKLSTHAIAGFMPARNVKTGKPEKGAVRTFRMTYESGMPSGAAGREFLNLLTYCLLSCITGELPSPNRASGESTIKGSIALSFVNLAGMSIESATVSNDETGASITLSGEAIGGILKAFDENRQRVERTWTPRLVHKVEAAGAIDWENL